MIRELYKIILQAGLPDRTTSANPPNLQKDRFIDNVISSTNQLVQITGWVAYWNSGIVAMFTEVMVMMMLVMVLVVMVVVVVMVSGIWYVS